MKSILITAVVALILGAAAGSQLFPTVKTKEVEVEKQVVVKDIVTVTKVITKADGTSETTTTTTDKTKENKQSTNTKVTVAPDWHVSVSARSDIWPIQVDKYTIQVERRILGSAFLGVNASTDKTVGVSLGVEF